MAMMTITTSSSISVNAVEREHFVSIIEKTTVYYIIDPNKVSIIFFEKCILIRVVAKNNYVIIIAV